jgi:hypothetical protein
MQYVKIKFLMEEVPTLKYDILSIITLEDLFMKVIRNIYFTKKRTIYYNSN